MGADLGRDRKARRHRQAEIGHLGETGALAAEQIAHLAPPLGGAAAKTIDPFRPTGRHGLSILRFLGARPICEKSAIRFMTAQIWQSRRNLFSRKAGWAA